jgi:hypothetical protein
MPVDGNQSYILAHVMFYSQNMRKLNYVKLKTELLSLLRSYFQEAAIPFKIRKKSGGEPKKIFTSSVATPPSVVIRKTGLVSKNGFTQERKLHLNQSDFIDQKIQNSIKEFFRESSAQ